MFLHILDYAPLEPYQDYDDEIHETRVLDDLRRFKAYQGGSDPVVLRVYPQPTADLPNRMPQSFYDRVRELGFWIIRDVYLPDDCNDATGHAAIDDVIAEVEQAGAMDLIFAWEFGNEYHETPCKCADLEAFLNSMCQYFRNRMAEPGRRAYSSLLTWTAYPPYDPLYTDPYGCPVDVADLDYYSYNAYSYWPDHIRDHQGGKGTGTPYAGYLAALKEYVSDKPLVISETGLADSSLAGNGDQPRLKPWYPTYRYGGLSGDQVSEGLADRHWDARLTGVAGLAFFEWNDEWWKAGAPSAHNNAPEEYFGLLSFDKHEPGVVELARYKLQQQTVRDLFTMRLPCDSLGVTLHVEDESISSNGTTTIHAEVTGGTLPVRFRWEASRGHIVGDSDTVRFYAGGRALALAQVTAVAIDAEGCANSDSADLEITTPQAPTIELLTLGTGGLAEARASGRVADVDLGDYKVIVYVETNQLYIQPYGDMKSIWVRPDGYWWTPIDNRHDGDLLAWVVPVSFDPPEQSPIDWSPLEAVASDGLDETNDTDNDLLPDTWELEHSGTLDEDRYGDPDTDGADNLDEFLAGTAPTVPDNDVDADGLPDTWELRYFGTLGYDADDDPDGDGLANETEFTLGIHPGRTAVDQDRDGLPDSWELRWFGDLYPEPGDDPNGDGYTILDTYELGLSPLTIPTVSREGLIIAAVLLLAAGTLLLRRRGVRQAPT